ncbi:MAG TPA: S8 family serine peptidase [Microvirga sp.]|jgi:subtilisin-like proprotein convertase family protein
MGTYQDPLSASQWHLLQIGYNKLAAEYNGARVRIGIFDDGVEQSHPDLACNYDQSLHVVLGGSAVAPGTGTHGTAVAGIIASGANGLGGVGVANGARIAGVNIFDGAAALSFSTTMRQMTRFDVVNNSWGPAGAYSDNPHGGHGFGDDFQKALAKAAEQGRKGLGSIVVNAAGNDWAYDHRDANTSAFNQDRHSISVGAVTDQGHVSAYTTRGASLLVSAPSSGGARGIVTTDVSGDDGYEAGDDTATFGGTSAAAPIVSGVAALMLQANARLGWRDVQEILAITADRVGGSGGAEAFRWTTNKADHVNGGGLHFSNDVGFGRVDAFSAVRKAEVWSLFGRAQTSANEMKAAAAGEVDKAVSENRAAVFRFRVDDQIDLEHVDLSLTLGHRDVSQLQVEIVSPEGTRSIVLSPGGDSRSVSDWTWTMGSEAFRGEASRGVWTVRVIDKFAGAAGRIDSFAFEGFGSKAIADDVFHFTDEFSALAAADPRRSTVRDRDGGTDWLDFAGLTQDIVLSLKAGTHATVDGSRFLTIAPKTAIENAVLGDGNDRVVGNDFSNKIYGMRGDDWLVGGRGADLLHGGAGTDTADYGSSGKAVQVALGGGRGKGGDAQGDTLRSIENLFGSRFGDTLKGDGGNNRLDGRAGNDVLTGGSGSDGFVFSSAGFGHDRVTDFTVGADRLDLTALGLAFEQIAISETGQGAHIAAAGGSILLAGVQAALLGRGDFLL